MDYNSNVSIFVANNLLRKKEELKIFEDFINIQSLSSFRIIIQLKHKAAPSKTGVLLTEELKSIIERLEKCATCFSYNKDTESWIMDFYVNDATKQAFLYYFKSAFELYSSLYKLELLNSLIVPEGEVRRIKKIREEKHFVIKPPSVSDLDKVFRFEEVRLFLKNVDIPIDYIGLSDGQHQFVHVFGTIMMVDNDDALFILDEPETHFNPLWRSNFVKILNALTINRKQDYFLTTHSPFILSDSARENVYIFEIDPNTGKTIWNNPSDETYGAAMENLLKIAFKIDVPVSEVSLEDIRQLQKSDNAEEIEHRLNDFGESIEKFYLLRRIRELKSKQQ